MVCPLKKDSTGFDQVADDVIMQQIEKQCQEMSENRLNFNELYCGKSNASLSKIRNLDEVIAVVESVMSTFAERIYSSPIRIGFLAAWDGSDDHNIYSKFKGGDNETKKSCI